MAGPNVRAIVELNDMTYGNHYEILVDLLRSSQPPPAPRSTLPPPLPAPVPVGLIEDRRRTDPASTAHERQQQQHQPQRGNGFSPGSTSEGFGNFTLSASSVARFRRGKTGGERGGRSRRRWWRRLFGVGENSPDGPLAPPGGEGSGRRGTRQSQQISALGSTAVGGSTIHPPTGAAAADATASAGRAKEGRRARAHWTLTKGVASGAIVPSSLPEILLCQAFYNPAIIMIVEALLDPNGQGYGKVKGSENITRRCDRNNEKGCVPRPERDDDGNTNDAGGDTKSEEAGGGPGGGGNREGRQGRERGQGEASFLAQILPPKTFFAQAMLGGHRPNFQVNFRFYPPPQ